MKIISIWSPKGGVGKTTLSAHVADCLATEHQRSVVVYDSDPQKTFYHTWENGSFGFNAVDAMPDNPPNVDFFIIDYPPTINLTREAKELLSASDLVIVPVRASRLDLSSAKAVTDYVDPAKILNVLSCYDQRITDQKEVYEHIAGDYMIISYLSIYARTMNDFKTIYTRGTGSLHGTNRARKEIDAIIKILI